MPKKKERPALRLPEGTRGVTGIGDMSSSGGEAPPPSQKKETEEKSGARPGASKKTAKDGAETKAGPGEDSFAVRKEKKKVTKIPRTYMLHEETIAGLEHVKEEYGITISSYVQKVLAAALKRDFNWPPKED